MSGIFLISWKKEKKLKKKLWTALIVSSLILSGCATSKNKWNDVPLTDSDVPFLVPAGEYTDVDGVVHITNEPRWVLDENDLYDFIQWLKLQQGNINTDKE